MSAATPNVDLPPPAPSRVLKRVCAALIAAGLVLSAVAALSGPGLVIFSYAYIWGFTFVWSVVLGSLLFVALQHLSHARWSIGIRRVAEMLASPMWLLAIMFVPVLGFVLFNDTFHLFPWADSQRVASDHLLHHKAPYLNSGFFTLRAAAFFAVWIFFARFFVNASLAQDSSSGLAVGKSLAMRKMSAPFVILFGLTASFAGIDWLMSLEPHWFSTIFGVYVFIGSILAALAAITLGVVWLERSGRLGRGLIRSDHLYSLGGLLFAFVCFWAYIAFSQFMLIWYGHIPEETFFYFDRTSGGWLAVSLLLGVLRFVLPFLLLLSRPSKSNPKILVPVSILILLGQLLDLFWIIAPQLTKNPPAAIAQALDATPLVHGAMIGPALLLSGLVLLACGRFLARHKMMPVGDPLLDEWQRFHL